MTTAPNQPSRDPSRSGAAPAAPGAIVMAAGKGTRMQSDLPKVMHPVAGRPMIHWVVDALRDLGVTPIVLVVGHGAPLVRAAFEGSKAPVEFVVQEPQLGTGHAVEQARPLFDAGRLGRECLVLAGDGPLVRTATLQTLLAAHRKARAAATLATSRLDDPTGYGRIVRDASGAFERIVEHKDASPAERAIHEVNPSVYGFDTARLFTALRSLRNDNASREYYLTDVFGLLRREGAAVAVVDAVPPEDVLSINTLAELAEVDRLLRVRLGSAAPPAQEVRS